MTYPRDIAEVSADELAPFFDVGSLLVPPREGVDLQFQVDEASGIVVAMVMVGPGGAMEVRAFAASRGDDLWAELRPLIAQDAVARGGAAADVEGPSGIELACELPLALEDGTTIQHPSRVIAFNGPRWLLRAALLGDAATDEALSSFWREVFDGIVVRRGSHAVPPGEPLPLVLPAQAQQLGESNG